MQKLVGLLNMRGEPLMPCRSAKARHLLREGKAKVASCHPFTLQMTVATGENRQPLRAIIRADGMVELFRQEDEYCWVFAGELTEPGIYKVFVTEDRRPQKQPAYKRKPRRYHAVKTHKKHKAQAGAADGAGTAGAAGSQAAGNTAATAAADSAAAGSKATD